MSWSELLLTAADRKFAAGRPVTKFLAGAGRIVRIDVRSPGDDRAMGNDPVVGKALYSGPTAERIPSGRWLGGACPSVAGAEDVRSG